MSEVVSDVVQPIELVVPTKTHAFTGKQGDLFLSGNKLYINVDGSTLELITSA